MSSLMIHDKCLYHDRTRKMFYVSEKLAELLRNPEAISFLKQGKDFYISDKNIYDRWYYLNRKGHEKRYCFRSFVLTEEFDQSCEKIYYLIGDKILIANKVWYKLIPYEFYL